MLEGVLYAFLGAAFFYGSLVQHVRHARHPEEGEVKLFEEHRERRERGDGKPAVE